MKAELYPTIVTPFTPDNQIDYGSLGRLIDHFFKHHCDGIFAVCQSSEMFFLSDEEKLALAAFSIDRCHAAGKKCVVSGHTHDSLDEQIVYLRELEKLAPDAIILVTNRLARQDEGDGILIKNLQAIISRLDPGTRLGLYECPHPYKRLLSAEVIDYLVSTCRFDFIKDTCCQIEVIRARLRQTDGSTIRLYNANAATLLESLQAGAAGYSGIMLNFIPEIFSMFRRYFAEDATGEIPPLQHHIRSAGAIADLITLTSVYECQKYPVNAKHYLKTKGIIDCTRTRSVTPDTLTESQTKELAALANQAEKIRSRADLFRQRQLIFESGKHFRSCHASTILVLDDGTVLVAYFAGHAEGNNDVGIWLSRCVDGAWQEPVRIAKTEDLPHWNPVLFKVNDQVRLVFKVGPDVTGWTSRTMLSADQGVTWSEAVAYPENEAGGPVRSKPILLSNGRLLAPNSDESQTRWCPRVDVSDDGGASFQIATYVPINTADPDKANYLSGIGAIQPTLWESRPGHVHMLLRTTCGFIFRSDSEDYGNSWCEAYNTHLPNNNSGIEIARDGSDLYLVMNPVSGNWASRNPLVIKRSGDNGRTFNHFLTLDACDVDPLLQIDAEYSYPSAVVAGRRLHVAYTYNRRQIAWCAINLDRPD
jgi:predicted neuraminidase